MPPEIDVSLRLARVDEKPAVRVMLDEYLQELSQYGTFDLSYPYFDLFWQEPERKPYLIEYDGRSVGLIFLNHISFSGKPINHAIAEFYVTREFRQQGVGRRAFQEVIAKRPGQWELCIFNANTVSIAFWRNAISSVRPTSLEEIPIPHKTVFRFGIV